MLYFRPRVLAALSPGSFMLLLLRFLTLLSGHFTNGQIQVEVTHFLLVPVNSSRRS